MTPQDKSSDNLTRPKKSLPAAMAAGAARFAFRPGRVGVMMCEAKTHRGTPCHQIAVKGLRNKAGLRVCYVHGRVALEHIRRQGRPRCEAWNIRRPSHQCVHPAKRNGLCGHHVAREDRGLVVPRTPATLRMARVPFRSGDTGARALARGKFKRASVPQALRPVAYDAPRELQALNVWREASPGERMALAHAWQARDTSPGAWRNLVREIMTREAL